MKLRSRKTRVDSRRPTPPAPGRRPSSCGRPAQVSGLKSQVSGFTLVEVLLALALLSILLLALNQFIFSMGELWGQNRQRRLFDQHVRAVTRHVEDMLQRASVAPVANHEVRMVTSQVPMITSGPLLTFDLPAGDRLLPWPERPLPDVQCSLDALSDRGLVLHWQSRWETDFETAAPRTVVLSPLVKRLEYDYYRAESRDWQTQTWPPRDKKGGYAVPSRLKLHFEYGKLVADAVVRVPPTTGALPAF